MNLAVFQRTPLPSAPRIPLALDRLFKCEVFNCVQQGLRCIQRQKLTLLNRGRQKSRRTYHGFCASGRCDQGAQIVRAFPNAKVAEVQLSDWSAFGLRSPAKIVAVLETKVCARPTCAKMMVRKSGQHTPKKWALLKFCSVGCSRLDGAKRRAVEKAARR